MNKAWIALAALPASMWAQASPSALPPIGVEDKASIHALWTVSPSSLLADGAFAGYEQWQNEPREWGQGGRGYGRRYASVLGYAAARNAMGFALDAALHEDPRYFRSTRTGFGARTADVLRQTFIGRTDSGRRTFAFWRFGSAYGAGFLSNVWTPDSMNSTGDALIAGTLRIAADTGLNWFREFWPDIKRKFGRK